MPRHSPPIDLGTETVDERTINLATFHSDHTIKTFIPGIAAEFPETPQTFAAAMEEAGGYGDWGSEQFRPLASVSTFNDNSGYHGWSYDQRRWLLDFNYVRFDRSATWNFGPEPPGAIGREYELPDGTWTDDIEAASHGQDWLQSIDMLFELFPNPPQIGTVSHGLSGGPEEYNLHDPILGDGFDPAVEFLLKDESARTFEFVLADTRALATTELNAMTVTARVPIPQADGTGWSISQHVPIPPAYLPISTGINALISLTMAFDFQRLLIQTPPVVEPVPFPHSFDWDRGASVNHNPNVYTRATFRQPRFRWLLKGAALRQRQRGDVLAGAGAPRQLASPSSLVRQGPGAVR